MVRLQDNFDKSQRALATFERRSRYLESALATSVGGRKDSWVGPEAIVDVL